VTEKFTLWAQALDNASSDHFALRGEELSPDDSVRRQAAVSSVSSVIKNGTRVCDVRGVLLTVDDRRFVLEVPSAQRDHAGRTAPIVCYGEADTAVTDALGTPAVVALADFAKHIGRTVQPEHLELARGSFEALKKKSSTTKLVRTGGIAGVALVLLAIVYWLWQRSW
jgi:hypothetical protein